MDQITIHPIGVIHSPYNESKDIPIQGRFKDDVEAFVELKNVLGGMKRWIAAGPLVREHNETPTNSSPYCPLFYDDSPG